jgi:hypothetical protein
MADQDTKLRTLQQQGTLNPRPKAVRGSSTKYRTQPAAPSKKTPLNAARDTPAARQDLAAHYEQLRRDAMARSTCGAQGLGLALFLRRGMTAWMQAWSEYAGNVAPPTPVQPGADETISVDIRSQVTTLLASMILSLQQEAIP